MKDVGQLVSLVSGHTSSPTRSSSSIPSGSSTVSSWALEGSNILKDLPGGLGSLAAPAVAC